MCVSTEKKEIFFPHVPEKKTQIPPLKKLSFLHFPTDCGVPTEIIQRLRFRYVEYSETSFIFKKKNCLCFFSIIHFFRGHSILGLKGEIGFSLWGRLVVLVGWCWTSATNPKTCDECTIALRE